MDTTNTGGYILLSALQTLGCQILRHEFRCAARLYQIKHVSKKLVQESYNSLAFITEDGLTQVIKFYHLAGPPVNVEPQRLLYQFKQDFHIKEWV